MLIRVYINNKFSHALLSDHMPRVGEGMKYSKNSYRVTDIIWRMKGNGFELLHVRLYLK